MRSRAPVLAIWAALAFGGCAEVDLDNTSTSDPASAPADGAAVRTAQQAHSASDTTAADELTPLGADERSELRVQAREAFERAQVPVPSGAAERARDSVVSAPDSPEHCTTPDELEHDDATPARAAEPYAFRTATDRRFVAPPVTVYGGAVGVREPEAEMAALETAWREAGCGSVAEPGTRACEAHPYRAAVIERLSADSDAFLADAEALRRDIESDRERSSER